jgi:hypothetical protein
MPSQILASVATRLFASANKKPQLYQLKQRISDTTLENYKIVLEGDRVLLKGAWTVDYLKDALVDWTFDSKSLAFERDHLVLYLVPIDKISRTYTLEAFSRT